MCVCVCTCTHDLPVLFQSALRADEDYMKIVHIRQNLEKVITHCYTNLEIIGQI